MTSTQTWQLTGITTGRSACDHCGRSLTRLFRVNGPQGDAMVVGRVCSQQLTGYKWSVAQAERAEATRLAELAAAQDYGQLWDDLRAAQAACGARTGQSGPAGEGVLVLRDRPGYMTEDERVAFARKMLAAS